MKLNELKTSQNRKILVYGDSGSGKTCFVTSAPGPIYVFDMDGKISSAAAYLADTDVQKLSQIEFDPYTPTQQAGGLDVFKKFEQKLVALEDLSKKADFPYRTVAVDSLTTFANSLMQYIMRENPGVKRYAVGVPALQDYSILINRFIPLISRLLALPCNVICTAHIKTDKNEATGEMVYRPMLPGQLPEQLPIVFEEMYRAFCESRDSKVNHLAQTRSDQKYNCRTQIRGIPQFIRLGWVEMDKYMNPPKVEIKNDPTQSKA